MRNHGWLILLPLLGCSLPQPNPPAAEFLVADGSSTYWVTSGPTGIHARVSPLILAHVANRYYQVFVGESTRSYQDAVFSAEPIYRRDLVSGDTTLLWEDPKINAWETVYLARHPSARLLDPDDGDQDAVALSATGESEISGIVGPYVLYTHNSMIQKPDMERADTARGIIDVRTAKTVELAALQHDTASISNGGITSNGITSWHHGSYDVIARFDSARAQSELTLRDKLHRSWKLGFVNSLMPRIYWLDEPPVDARVRTALVHAFEGALSDDDTSQLASSAARHASPGTRSQ